MNLVPAKLQKPLLSMLTKQQSLQQASQPATKQYRPLALTPTVSAEVVKAMSLTQLLKRHNYTCAGSHRALG